MRNLETPGKTGRVGRHAQEAVEHERSVGENTANVVQSERAISVTVLWLARTDLVTYSSRSNTVGF